MFRYSPATQRVHFHPRCLYAARPVLSGNRAPISRRRGLFTRRVQASDRRARAATRAKSSIRHRLCPAGFLLRPPRSIDGLPNGLGTGNQDKSRLVDRSPPPRPAFPEPRGFRAPCRRTPQGRANSACPLTRPDDEPCPRSSTANPHLCDHRSPSRCKPRAVYSPHVFQAITVERSLH